MKERLHKKILGIFTSSSTLFNRPFFKMLAREAGESGATSPHKIAEHMLKKMNIVIDYVQESLNPEWHELRRRLNEEAGVVICNHPIRIEVLALLSMITRKDVKAIASKLTIEMASPVFGKEYFIKVDPEGGRANLEKAVQEVRQHIQNGGLLILFPTGSSRRDVNAPFRGGFRMFLKEALASGNMVYACKANLEDIERLRKERLQRLLALILPQGIRERINKKIKLRMDERYTTAGEWQTKMRGDSPAEDNRLLTAYYESLFTEDTSKD